MQQIKKVRNVQNYTLPSVFLLDCSPHATMKQLKAKQQKHIKLSSAAVRCARERPVTVSFSGCLITAAYLKEQCLSVCPALPMLENTHGLACGQLKNKSLHDRKTNHKKAESLFLDEFPDKVRCVHM